MRISYSTMATPHLSGIEAIKLAARYGYMGIDLRVSGKYGEYPILFSCTSQI